MAVKFDDMCLSLDTIPQRDRWTMVKVSCSACYACWRTKNDTSFQQCDSDASLYGSPQSHTEAPLPQLNHTLHSNACHKLHEQIINTVCSWWHRLQEDSIPPNIQFSSRLCCMPWQNGSHCYMRQLQKQTVPLDAHCWESSWVTSQYEMAVQHGLPVPSQTHTDIDQFFNTQTSYLRHENKHTAPTESYSSKENMEGMIVSHIIVCLFAWGLMVLSAEISSIAP